MPLNVDEIRQDFPVLQRRFDGRRLIYLDNAATTQKPRQVIEALRKYYSSQNANVHRGAYRLSDEATRLYEQAHEEVAHFINAESWEEVVFVRNTTEAINLVMYSWGLANVGEGDEILVTIMEHHSNMLPWQKLASLRGARVVYADITEEGYLDMGDFEEKLGERTRLVAVTHVSNVLGTINPVRDVCRRAHDHGALCLVDGAQAAPHMPVDVRALEADFYAFSGHKMMAPMGIGVLYGRKDVLEDMDPFLVGGGMIKDVWLDRAEWEDLPWRFEAGTPNVGGAAGLMEAIRYLRRIGMENILAHEQELTERVLRALLNMDDVTVLGPRRASDKGGVVSFNVGEMHPHDLSHLMDTAGIAIRSGHHCAIPLHRRLGYNYSSRASFYLYNTVEEADIFINAVEKATQVWRKWSSLRKSSTEKRS